MKQILVYFLFLLFPLSGFTQVQPGNTKLRNIAVTEFEGKNISTDELIVISELIRNNFAAIDKYNVLSRNDMCKIFDEQKLKTFVCPNSKYAVLLGKMLKVDLVGFGSVTNRSNSYLINLYIVDVETSKNIHLNSSMDDLEKMPLKIGELVKEYEQKADKKKFEEQVNKIPALKKIIEKKMLVVGLEASYPPFEFKNDAGQIVGLDVDIANQLANMMNVKLNTKEIRWDELITNLNNGKIDIVISAMTRTLSRERMVDFSESYYTTGQAVLLNTKVKDVCSVNDLNSGKFRIGVQQGTTGEEYAKNVLSKAVIIMYDDFYSCQTDLINNKIEAIIFDKPLTDEVKSYGVFDEENTPFKQLTIENYCFAVKKGNPDFVVFLNKFISDLKNSGEYDRIYSSWLKK
jgi:polar amino acid transport system substrate-binding protein